MLRLGLQDPQEANELGELALLLRGGSRQSVRPENAAAATRAAAVAAAQPAFVNDMTLQAAAIAAGRHLRDHRGSRAHSVGSTRLFPGVDAQSYHGAAEQEQVAPWRPPAW